MSNRTHTPSKDQEAFWDAADRVAEIKRELEAQLKVLQEVAAELRETARLNETVAPLLNQAIAAVHNWGDDLHLTGDEIMREITAE